MLKQQKKEDKSFFSFPFILLVGITFFLPFERILTVDVSYITIRISHILLLLLFCISFAAILFRKLRGKWHHLYLFLFLYITSAIASLMFSVNTERSITVLSFTMFTMSIIFLLPLYIENKNQLKIVIRVLIWSTILVCLFGLYQLIGDLFNLPAHLTGLRSQYQKEILGFPRIQSTALEPLYFANFLLLPFSLLLSFFLAKSKQSFFILSILLLIGCNILLTGSRGGYLGVLVSISILLIVYWKKIFSFSLMIKISASLFFISIICIILLQLQANIINSRVDIFFTHVTTLFDGAAYVERSQTISQAYALFVQKPYLGFGLGSFGPLIASEPFTQPPAGWAIVNNQIMESLVETGIIGTSLLILFIILLCIQLIISYTKCRDSYIRAIMIGVFAALMGICAQYLTFSTLYILHIWYVVGLAFTCLFLTLYD